MSYLALAVFAYVAVGFFLHLKDRRRQALRRRMWEVLDHSKEQARRL